MKILSQPVILVSSTQTLRKISQLFSFEIIPLLSGMWNDTKANAHPFLRLRFVQAGRLKQLTQCEWASITLSETLAKDRKLKLISNYGPCYHHSLMKQPQIMDASTGSNKIVPKKSINLGRVMGFWQDAVRPLYGTNLDPCSLPAQNSQTLCQFSTC